MTDLFVTSKVYVVEVSQEETKSYGGLGGPKRCMLTVVVSVPMRREEERDSGEEG